MDIDMDIPPDDSMAHPALAALTNYVILSNLFEYLPLKELKQARIVCKDWEDLSASFNLGKCTLLNVRSVCKEYYEGLSPSEVLQQPRINHQLLRRVKIQNNESATVDKDECEDNQSPFRIFMDTHKDFIQEILFCLDWDFGPTLKVKVLLENVILPRLRKISIHETSDWTPHRGLPGTRQRLHVPPITTIRELVYHSIDAEMAGEPRDRSPYFAIFEDLLKNSPNLEKLTVAGNVYPDLRSASKLKSLQLTLFPFMYLEMNDGHENDEGVANDTWIRMEYSIRDLKQMLGQVNTGLEELILNSTTADGQGDFTPFQFNNINWRRWNNWRIEEDPFRQLPSFPKLNSLTINPIHGFVLKFSLSPQHFPSLIKLNLVMNGPMTDLEVLMAEMGPRTTLKDLSLSFNFIPEYQENAVRCLQQTMECCPNVTKLDVTLCGGSTTDFPIISDWLKEFGKLRMLSDMTLRIGIHTTLSQLLRGIAAAEFSGLKTLNLVANSVTNVEDDGWKTLEALFNAIPAKVVFNKEIRFIQNTVIGMLKCLEDK